MRIIAGSAKGHPLKAPKGTNTRPTSDKVRGAIFSVLAGKVVDATVLDVFAGSGGLGMEALSRGAEFAYFLEKDRNASLVIKANLEATKLKAKATVLTGLSQKLVPNLAVAFDLVFLDPPYNQGFIGLLEPLLLKSGVLKAETIVVLETNSKNQELFTDAAWQQLKTSVYGDTAVVYYGLKNQAS